MNPSFKKIKAVLFDFGGTLDSDGAPWIKQFYPLYRSAGLPWTFEKFEKLFYAADDFLTGKLPQSSYSQTIQKQVSEVLKRGKVKDPTILRAIVRAYLNQSVKKIKSNVPVLKRLGKKYRMGLVSNFYGNMPRVTRELKLTGLFQVIIDSEIVGYQKPDPHIFFLALDKLKVTPGASVFVGDSPNRDMAGAKAIGMKHIRLVSREIKKTKLCCSGDVRIGNLKDLEDLLL